jgi:hypothetical protein
MIRIMIKIIIIAGLLLPAVVDAKVIFQPEMLIVTIDTAQTIEREVSVTNQGEQSKNIWMDLEYHWQGKKKEVGNWIEIKPKQFSLKAGESKKVVLRFNQVKGKISDECQVILLAREKIKSTINLNIEIGMLIYARVNQATNVRGRIERLIEKKTQDGTLYFGTKIKNTGQMFLVPFGIAWIEQNGEQIWQTELKLSKPIAPGKTDMLKCRVPSDVKAAGGDMSVRIFWGTLYGIVSNPPKSQTASIRVSK